MTLKRSKVGILVGVLAGAGTIVFLTSMAASPSSRNVYVFYLYWLLWPSAFLILIPIPWVNKLSNKIISANTTYENYRRDGEALMENMTFDELRSTKVAMLACSWVSWTAVGVGLGCLVCRAVYGG